MGPTLLPLLSASLSPPAPTGDTRSPSQSSHSDTHSPFQSFLCSTRMLCTLGCSQAFIDSWHLGSNLGKICPQWVEQPHLGSRLPPPQPGGLWIGVGAFAAPGKQLCSLAALPGGARKEIPACSLQRLQGSAGSQHTHICAGGAAARAKREKNPNPGPGEMGHPLAGGPREPEQSCLGQEGRKITFYPAVLIADVFPPSAFPASQVSGEHCRGDAGSHPSFQRGAELQKSPLSRVRRGQRGGPTYGGDTGLCHTPSGAPAAAPCAPWHGRAQPRRVPGRGDTLPVPPRAVMSSLTRNSSVQDYFPSPFGLLFQGTGLIHRKNMKFQLHAAKMGEFQRISILREPGRVSVAGRLMK